MGGSSSKKETVNKTINRTETNTTVGDIGFTGENAIEFADIIAASGIQVERERQQSLRGLIDLTEGAFENITTQLGESQDTQQRQAELSAQTVGALAARASGDDPDESDPQRLERLAVVFGGVAVLLTLIQQQR